MILSGLLKPAFLFSLLIWLLMYLGVGTAEGMKGGGRQRITEVPCRIWPFRSQDLIVYKGQTEAGSCWVA